MTVIDRFDDWADHPERVDQPPYTTCSPNLQLIEADIERQWVEATNAPGQHLGCFVGPGGRRFISPGRPRAHATGSAFDRGYHPDQHDGPGRNHVLTVTFPWLIKNSDEFGVQAIHDYIGQRIWRPPGHSGRPPDGDGWKDVSIGRYWGFHVETHPDDWSNTTPIADRLTPDPDPEPVPPPAEEEPVIYIADTRAPFAQWISNGSSKSWLDTPGAAAAARVRATEEVETGDNDTIASYGAIVGPIPAGYDAFGRLA